LARRDDDFERAVALEGGHKADGSTLYLDESPLSRPTSCIAAACQGKANEAVF
jgi:hypothetical protein